MSLTAVLMVDDNPADVFLFQHAAAAIGSGAFIASAAGRQDAFAYIEQHGRPDLLVSDLHINGEYGLDLARELQALHGPMPTVFVSGSILPETEQTVKAKGAIYFRKPLDLDEWLRLATEILNGSAIPADPRECIVQPPATACSDKDYEALPISSFTLGQAPGEIHTARL
jgi:CheY-like chemotaxis protein